MKEDPRHPSIRLKKVRTLWSAIIGFRYRALAVENEDGLLWFWFGTHAEYDGLLRWLRPAELFSAPCKESRRKNSATAFIPTA